ncbi:uncharacterized protein YjdB [Clostridium acetobutylicum]|uniref:Protein containing ChW-repeats n=1 Tax=Clostridium acetobutylicum (strain ATCC 824 / DSM 792 / JCM 1419 / IAM 19013 / LMG 5710 / NBRC 13948 / NRRL B-527 / VKM B-1787 / 2291 / W) TaxID=272562 RepID=Q97IV8_CLOAB|nr:MULTISPECIES: hypothetical protein [Clostridium]AAK79499.1 Protein containing ChW-repeats [Clostridium acetobutylicum ATCC 824]ADZ20584.1 Protein containing ChW-repeats [Clostridium acetobutylicum EA 2018]AEI31858.1 ChW repeat-containing protein [Clostridium acetobutylicum DSM 1731]AWV81256.1 hypothetical protein DK921_14385 [Clostridium acetobutylicum]MBC2392890.1 hypothetical protein [Clostridium acetobutylicum]
MKNKKIVGFIAAAAVAFGLGLPSNSHFNADTEIGISYQGHVENIGWQAPKKDGEEAGTDGKGLRVEALKLNLTNAPAGAHIEYQGHVENIGWQDWKTDGQEAGTDGKGLRVEALKIKLKNMPGYSIQYRAHVQNVGWQDWVSDGQEAGTDGKGLRVEALEIKIVKVSDNSTVGVSYVGHVQNVGWQEPNENGQISGTEGQGLRVEALKLNLVNAPEGAHIKYQGHVENIGWQDPAEDGQETGTDGQGLRVEAIKIALENMPGYSVQYRAHVQNVGWQNWVSDGQESGTDGKGLRVEAIEVRIVKTQDGSTPKPVDFIPVNNTPAPTDDDSNIPEPKYENNNINTEWDLSDKLNDAMGKTKNPVGSYVWYNNSQKRISDVFGGLNSDSNKVEIGDMSTDEMKADIEDSYKDNDGGLYTSNNGIVYKVAGVYKEIKSTKSNDLTTLKAAAQKLNTQFITSGYDPSQTFDRFYVNTDGSGTHWVVRVLAYFTNK